MPVILSRKGIDSSSGGMYSPINCETGEYVFIPKPENKNQVSKDYKGIDYKLLRTDFMSFNNIYEILQFKNRIPKYGAHIDPDLVNCLQLDNWKPIFGQTGPAQGYLRNRGIDLNSLGSIFLFFSRFKPWETNASENFSEGYYIYGWLQIEKIVNPSLENIEYLYHPHLKKSYMKNKNNILYVATKNFCNTNIPGAGMFGRLTEELRLSNQKYHKLLAFKLPSCSFNGFSRLKNYKKLGKGYCIADWPQSHGQAAVCSCRTSNSKIVSKTKEWAEKLICRNVKQVGLKQKYL